VLKVKRGLATQVDARAHVAGDRARLIYLSRILPVSMSDEIMELKVDNRSSKTSKMCEDNRRFWTSDNLFTLR